MTREHSVQLNGRSPLGLRCGNKECPRNLTGQELYDWFASFVDSGTIRCDLMVPPNWRDVDTPRLMRDLRPRPVGVDLVERDAQAGLDDGDSATSISLSSLSLPAPLFTASHRSNYFCPHNPQSGKHSFLMV